MWFNTFIWKQSHVLQQTCGFLIQKIFILSEIIIWLYMAFYVAIFTLLEINTRLFIQKYLHRIKQTCSFFVVLVVIWRQPIHTAEVNTWLFSQRYSHGLVQMCGFSLRDIHQHRKIDLWLLSRQRSSDTLFIADVLGPADHEAAQSVHPSIRPLVKV